jgi:transposase
LPHIICMSQSKQRNKKAAPPRPRPDVWFKEVSAEVLRQNLVQLREAMGECEVYDNFRVMTETMLLVRDEAGRKGVSLQRLRFLLFGPKTESFAAVCRKAREGGKSKEPREKAKGHGRNGADDFPKAKRVPVPLEGAASGEPCPHCPNGKVYPLKEPSRLLRITGVAPFTATIYELERRRCNLCGEVFTAPAPSGVGSEKYNHSVAALLGLLRYGAGLPMNRIERLQLALGIPLPVSTQWELILEAAHLLAPAHAELARQAAQGQVLYNDDTVMRILEKSLPAKEGRKATYTSAILSRLGEHRIALFITGHNHAGENLEAVLRRRAEHLPAPIQMCDALAANTVGEAGELNTILAHCLAHARRRFVEVENRFPDEVEHLLKELREVYRTDAQAKREGLDPQARLALHQERSGPIMASLEAWLRDLIEGSRVEPNSGLGQAITYMRKYWVELTLFLREPGAPLDNNLCEATLKRAIMHRKNSLFYRSVTGARAGDTFMSLIHSAELNGVEPFEYLIELLKHPDEVRRDPAMWMPWSYPAQVALPN